MAAQDEQHLYSLPYDSIPLSTRDYNMLDNKPTLNGKVISGDRSLEYYGIPTKTSDLTNDSGFITSADVPTKTSELTNDTDFTTKEYVDGEIDTIETQLAKYDGITVVKNFLIEDTFNSTFDNLAATLALKMAAIKESLASDEFVELKDLKINTIGNLKPTATIIITPSTDLLSLVIDWQGFTYTNNIIQAIDILHKKVVMLTMTNDTNNDGFVSYYEDSNVYNFTLDYTKYKTISLV